MKIFSAHHERDDNGFKEWREGSDPQSLSRPNVYDKVEQLGLVFGEFIQVL